MLATRFSRSGAPWFAVVLALASAPLLIANPEAGYSVRDDDSLIGKAASGIIKGCGGCRRGGESSSGGARSMVSGIRSIQRQLDPR